MGVNNLPRVVTQPRPRRESNSRPLDRKSDALPLRYHAPWRLAEGLLVRYIPPLAYYSNGNVTSPQHRDVIVVLTALRIRVTYSFNSIRFIRTYIPKAGRSRHAKIRQHAPQNRL